MPLLLPPLLVSVSMLALESIWAPHLFTTPHVYRQLQAHHFGLRANRQDNVDLQFLSQDDLSALRSLVDSHRAAKHAIPAEELRQQVCDIPRVETPISLNDFMIKYGGAPAVISAMSGVGSLPFPVTARLIKQLEPERSLTPCLCLPEHGTNFVSTQNAQGLNPKRYCLWELPLFVELLLGNNRSATDGPAEIPDSVGAPTDDQPVSNLELSQALDFQCRVGVTRITDSAGSADPRQRLVRTIVNSLGSTSPAPRRGSDRHAAAGSWWGAANLDDEQRIHSAWLWLSTALTRTPLHADDQMQWLVQLQGTKLATVYPETAKISATEAQRLMYKAKAYGGPFVQRRDNTTQEGATTKSTGSPTVQRCLLQPGEVLWLPAGVMHDIFAIDASISLNIRFNRLALNTTDGRRRKPKGRQRRRGL